MRKVIYQSITFAAVFAMLGLAATASANHVGTLEGNKDGGSVDMSEKGDGGHIEKGDAGHVNIEKGDGGHFTIEKGDAGH